MSGSTSGRKIDALPAASGLTGAEVFPIVQGGTTYAASLHDALSLDLTAVPAGLVYSSGSLLLSVTLGANLSLASGTLSLSGVELVANKGAVNGYAGLDGTGKVPSSQLPAAVVGALHFLGGWNASSNTPTLTNTPVATGGFYLVTNAGTTSLATRVGTITQWNVGDMLFSDGVYWDKIDGVPSEVTSVAGRTGAVVLAAADVSYLDPVASAVLRTIAAKWIDYGITLEDCGADPTGASYSDAAVLRWHTAVLTTGRTGRAGAGTFKLASQLVLDWGVNGVGSANAGGNFQGAGRARTVFDVSAVATIPPVLIKQSATGRAAFYGTVRDLGFVGSAAGQLVQLGMSDLADAFNEFRFDFSATNHSTSASACALEVNGAYNCKFFVVCNNGGHGDAARFNQMQFSEVFGSFANADVSVHLTGGVVAANKFSTLDMEVVARCVVIDASGVADNQFSAGTYVWTNGVNAAIAAIDATAGSSNRFFGPHFASAGAKVAGSVGIIIYGQGYGSETLGGLTISPASGDGDLILDSVVGNSAYDLFRVNGGVRWALGRNNASETGSNAGSDFNIIRYSDAGASIDMPLTISRATGTTTLKALVTTGTGSFGAALSVAPAAGDAVGILASAASGAASWLYLRVGASMRWLVGRNSVAETGSNAGSDYQITRYTDAGTSIDNPLSISRATGTTTLKALALSTGTVTGLAVPWSQLPAEAQNLPLGFIIPGKPAASQTYNLPMAMAVTLPAGLAGTVVYDVTLASANATFIVNKISAGVTTQLGTIVITSASNTSASLTMASAASLAAGDVLQIVAPSSQDATLADVGITILAAKV